MRSRGLRGFTAPLFFVILLADGDSAIYKETTMAKAKKISVAAAEAMYRQVKMKRDRQVQALADTELQLAGCEELLAAAREQDKQADLTAVK